MVELQHADLKDMGIDSFGHRLTILKSIYEVKMKQNVPLDSDHFIPLCKSWRHSYDDCAEANFVKLRMLETMSLHKMIYLVLYASFKTETTRYIPPSLS